MLKLKCEFCLFCILGTILSDLCCFQVVGFMFDLDEAILVWFIFKFKPATKQNNKTSQPTR